MAEFEVLGTRYPLAFTIRVVEKVCERYGSLENFDNLAKERTDIELLKRIHLGAERNDARSRS